MRVLLSLALLLCLHPASAWADPVTFAGKRFSLEFPAAWKEAKGPDDGSVVYREAPEGQGSFSVYTLPVKKDHRANLEGTLQGLVKSLGKSGLQVADKVEGQEGNVDGKKALFAVVPVKGEFQGQPISFRYYLVLADAGDTVVVMQAVLSHPAPAELQKAALGIIQSFKEKQDKEEE